jgi:hypothetical protein
MAWVNNPVTLFHGTTGRFADAIANFGIDLKVCRPLSDFGRGFYTTSNLAQAIEHANNIYRRRNALYHRGTEPDPLCAAYLTFQVDRTELAKLTDLVFVSPTVDWQEFVRYCRSTGGHHMPSSGRDYDLVYGPVQRFAGIAHPWNYEQVSFHSAGAINVIGTGHVSRGKPQL